MLRFVLTRLGHLIPTFIGVTIVAFAFIRLMPGDPIELWPASAASSPSAMPSCSAHSASTSRW